MKLQVLVREDVENTKVLPRLDCRYRRMVKGDDRLGKTLRNGGGY